MKRLNEYIIPFVGLKDGEHQFDFDIDQKFFDAFGYDEYVKTNFKVDLKFVKKTTFMELEFKASGFVTVPCDVSGELFNLETEGDLSLVVKFGPEFDDSNEEVLILPQSAYDVNVSQYIYEMIVLAVPQKRVHPDFISEDDLEEEDNEDIIFDVTKEEQIENEQVSEDPRWDQLKKLLDKK